MTKSYSFSKYHGAGNDFILIQDVDQSFDKNLVNFFCDRIYGVGADGLILLQPSKIADAKMVYHNQDGSLAGMCGNGLRCFIHFLRDLGQIKPQYTIEVGGKILSATVRDGKIYTYLPMPRPLFWKVPLFGRTLYVVDATVPHAVVFAKSAGDVVEEGREIRHHPMWGGEGVNVNFVETLSKDQLRIATYERGVEAVTKACGTGAVACGFVAGELGLCQNIVEVIPPSGQSLIVERSDPFGLGGPTTKVFDGQITR